MYDITNIRPNLILSLVKAKKFQFTVSVLPWKLWKNNMMLDAGWQWYGIPDSEHPQTDIN